MMSRYVGSLSEEQLYVLQRRERSLKDRNLLRKLADGDKDAGECVDEADERPNGDRASQNLLRPHPDHQRHRHRGDPFNHRKQGRIKKVGASLRV